MHDLGYSSCPEEIFISLESHPSKSVVSSGLGHLQNAVGIARSPLDPILGITEVLERKSNWMGGGLHDSKSGYRISIPTFNLEASNLQSLKGESRKKTDGGTRQTGELTWRMMCNAERDREILWRRPWKLSQTVM